MIRALIDQYCLSCRVGFTRRYALARAVRMVLP